MQRKRKELREIDRSWRERKLGSEENVESVKTIIKDVNSVSSSYKQNARNLTHGFG